MIVLDVRTIPINGKKITFFRRRAKLTLEKLAQALDMSQSRVFKISKKENVPVFLETADKLRDVLKLSEDEFNELTLNSPIAPDLALGPMPPIVQKLYPVPVSEMRVAAGPWLDIDGEEHVTHQMTLDQNLFRIRILGDSMQQTFPDGTLIEFEVFRFAGRNWPVGKHVLICTSDNRATFKTLVSVDEDEIVLRAINRQKYPKPLTLPIQLAARIAVARAIITVLE